MLICVRQNTCRHTNDTCKEMCADIFPPDSLVISDRPDRVVPHPNCTIHLTQSELTEENTEKNSVSDLVEALHQHPPYSRRERGNHRARPDPTTVLKKKNSSRVKGRRDGWRHGWLTNWSHGIHFIPHFGELHSHITEESQTKHFHFLFSVFVPKPPAQQLKKVNCVIVLKELFVLSMFLNLGPVLGNTCSFVFQIRFGFFFPINTPLVLQCVPHLQLFVFQHLFFFNLWKHKDLFSQFG